MENCRDYGCFPVSVYFFRFTLCAPSLLGPRLSFTVSWSSGFGISFRFQALCSGLLSLNFSVLLLERFFTCCGDRSFQGTNCQHKVNFGAFTKQNVVGSFCTTKQRTRQICVQVNHLLNIRGIDGIWRHLLHGAWKQMRRQGKERELKLSKQWQL